MKRLIYIYFLLLPVLSHAGSFKPAGIFGDNAVFQQGVMIPVWGKGVPGSTVEVEFSGQSLKTITDEDGKWIINFPPMSADGKSHYLMITCGEESISYEDIMIGEVWFASGQSNMAYTMNEGVEDGEKEIATANYPEIRFRMVEPAVQSMPADDIVQKEWMICDPNNVKSFSAVAYYFAKDLHLDKNIPVGVIVSAVGATGIGCWMSYESLLAYPPTRLETERFDPDTVLWNNRVRRVDSLNQVSADILTLSTVGLDEGVHKINFNDNLWNTTEYPMDIPKMGYPGFWGLVWMRKSFELSSEMAHKQWTLHIPMIVSDYRIYMNESEVKRGNTSLTDLEETQIEIPLGVLKEGDNLLALRMWIIWSLGILGDNDNPCYLQSEDGCRVDLTGFWTHNSDLEPEAYRLQDNYWFQSTATFNGMVAPVIPYAIAGFLWYQGEANHQWGEAYAEMQPLLTDDWRIRWKQGYLPFLYVQLAAFGDHSTTPVADDYMADFRDYQTTIMDRSINSYMACAIDAGEEKNIHPRNKSVVGKRLYATYKANVLDESNIGEGPRFESAIREEDKVRITFLHSPSGLKTSDGKAPLAFAVCNSDGEWVSVDAIIDNGDIVLSVVGIDNPTRVQYAWQGYPKVNLYNVEGFPVLPFNCEIESK